MSVISPYSKKNYELFYPQQLLSEIHFCIKMNLKELNLIFIKKKIDYIYIYIYREIKYFNSPSLFIYEI